MTAIEFKVQDWVEGDDSDPRRAGTSAELVIYVGELVATRLIDSWSRTVTDRARLPIYPLAEWFAANWWRLHAEAPYEVTGRPPVEWRLSHDLGAVGGGYVWPRLRFASDDHSMLATARAARNAPWEPVRHLTDIPQTAIPIPTFDRAVEDLIGLVLQRLRDLNISAEPLATIWANVCAERDDPEVAAWRSLEARLGYDPEEAPEKIMADLDRLAARVGEGASKEIAPLLKSRERAVLKRLADISVAPGIESRPSIRALKVDIGPEAAPWEIGREFAHELRREINRPTGPLEDGLLLDLLGARADAFERISGQAAGAAVEAPAGLGVRQSAHDKTVLHFRKRNRAGQRFEATRFLIEDIVAPPEDRWLPLTDFATARQKLQRAFGVEFLVPIKELQDELGENPSSEAMEDAGDRYGVSPLAIRSHLANHGLLSPDEVAL